MNVLAYTNLYPSVDEPTRGLFNLSKFRALRELCSVRVVAPVAAWKRYRRPSELFGAVSGSIAGIPATYPTYWTIPRIAPQRHADAIYRCVRSHVEDVRRTFPVDVIVGAFAYPDVVVASRLATDAGCPFVAIVMGSDINELAQRPALRGRITEALRQASAVIAVSGGLRDRVAELGIPSERVIVQHNGVDGVRFVIRDRMETRRQLGMRESIAHICFVGNLVTEKGPGDLVEAINDPALQAFTDVHVTFIGDGPLRDPLIARAEFLGIAKQVTFLGRIPPDDVALRMSASDVLCLPSRREGCPNVVLEAFASGLPVVGAAVGGVPELVRSDNGITVPPSDPSALASAIASALQRRWDPVAIRGTVPSLSWHDMASTLYAAITRAIDESR